MKFLKLLVLVLITNTIASFAQGPSLNVTFRSHLTYPGQTCANICGYVDSTGKEYALVGASVGLSIVDVSNPDSVFQVYQHVGPGGTKSKWQEIKVRGKYAYVTTEAGDGLQIFNLSSLPDTSGITVHNWTGNGAIAGQLNSIHALHIDNQFVYLYGTNLFGGGAVVADITDPWNPTYVGNYQSASAPYIHDGYVRNDTLYGGHIYQGIFSVVDFRNKTTPIQLASHATPNAFTHNTWLSTNSKVLFTTDEKENTFLTAYDISDLNNINELDRIQSNPGSNSIVHNVHIIRVAGNDYAVTSWYKDGFTIVDVGRPQNMVQVGNYDTYVESGGGFKGDWGVYPFLPSGTIVVSNIDEGLFVFTPNYVRGCYLEGAVTDSVCGVELNKVRISIDTVMVDSTDIAGEYKTGSAIPGTYNITFSRSGYRSKTISSVVLTRGNVTNLSVQLAPVNTVTINGLVSDVTTTTAIEGASIFIGDAVNNYGFTSNATGNFSSCNVVSNTDYDVRVGKWGYQTYCNSNEAINSSTANLSYPIKKGYYDDFTFNFGWTVTSTATSGLWERAVPKETTDGPTPANPGLDDSTDCSNMAYVTGNNGVTSSDNDVDNGASILTSPVFDLTSYTVPYLEYSRWFFNCGGASIPNDSLSIYLTNGSTTVRVETVTNTSFGNSTWVPKSFKISDYITPTATMKVIVRVADAEPGHLVEAGFDKFLIHEGPSGVEETVRDRTTINVYPNPFSNETSIAYELKNKLSTAASIVITDVTGRVVDMHLLSQARGTITINPKLTNGIYFVKVVNGDEHTGTVKVMKMD
jgi:choice-of-anchor B domain-containing protein